MRSTILTLDKEYELRFDTMALLRIEREYKKPLLEALKDIQEAGKGMSIDGLFKLMRCANKELAKLDTEKLCELVEEYAEGDTSLERFINVIGLCTKEIQNSMVGDEKKVREAIRQVQIEEPSNSAGVATKS